MSSYVSSHRLTAPAAGGCGPRVGSRLRSAPWPDDSRSEPAAGSGAAGLVRAGRLVTAARFAPRGPRWAGVDLIEPRFAGGTWNGARGTPPRDPARRAGLRAGPASR